MAGKNILHVEDEADIAEVAKVALEELGGSKVTTCSSGEEALARLQDWSPDLILLDAMMPGLDGLAMLAELSKIPRAAEIPVIFITAKTQQAEVKRFIDAGAIGVVLKPFDPVTLHDEWRGSLQPRVSLLRVTSTNTGGRGDIAGNR